jgi:hypothetical protein
MTLMQLRLTPDTADLLIRALDELGQIADGTPDGDACAAEAAHIKYRAVRLWGQGWTPARTVPAMSARRRQALRNGDIQVRQLP